MPKLYEYLGKEIEITNAKYIGGYKVKIVFNDKSIRTINFDDFLKMAGNPMTKKFLNKEKFKNFKLKYGDLVWGDYEMCFPIWDLYKEHV